MAGCLLGHKDMWGAPRLGWVHGDMWGAPGSGWVHVWLDACWVTKIYGVSLG